jgi:hypothetical protein
VSSHGDFVPIYAKLVAAQRGIDVRERSVRTAPLDGDMTGDVPCVKRVS